VISISSALFVTTRLHIVGSAHIPENPERVYFTRNIFLEKKDLPKELICFSFSTGFLFVKKKKCCEISWFFFMKLLNP